jgi:hypothetical protein
LVLNHYEYTVLLLFEKNGVWCIRFEVKLRYIMIIIIMRLLSLKIFKNVSY